MRRFEVSIEVAPLTPGQVDALKHAGHAVYKGNRSWRVVAIEDVLAKDSVRAQAHVHVRQLVEQFGLVSLEDPPAFGLRDPDDYDAPGTNLMLDETFRSYDPDPLTRPPRRWWQRMMELGLGERKGD